MDTPTLRTHDGYPGNFVKIQRFPKVGETVLMGKDRVMVLQVFKQSGTAVVSAPDLPQPKMEVGLNWLTPAAAPAPPHSRGSRS
jgi:hypothetical protein